ncbi:hypothetical protein BVY03_03185 [bacterium K02(2017)]|nr:hypothetical protein BVY03_03185 [bacterium K02(2017)]
MLLSSLVGACSALLVSYAEITKIVVLLIFFQATLSFLLTFKKSKFKIHVIKKNYIIAFFRTIFGLGIYYAYYMGLSYKNPATSSLLLNMAPILVPFLLMYKKKLSLIDIIAVCLCFGGLVIFQDFDFNNIMFGPILLWGLLSSFCFALTIVLVDKMKEKMDTSEIINLYSLFSIIIIFPFALPYFEEILELPLWFYIANSVLFYLRQYTINHAAGMLPATYIGPLNYFTILFIWIFDVLIKDIIIQPHQIFGFIIILLSFIILKFGQNNKLLKSR